ncbi:MAG: Unknown protein, partial [uncultured Sulfurovum sp.]
MVVDDNITNDSNKSVVVDDNLFGKAQLGVMSKAKVKLYELEGMEKKLLATQLTTHGESIETIGNFNLYLEKLEEHKFYLYEVEGGEDYDVDDNGIIDESPTQNKGVFHLLVKGGHLKATEQANVTVVSEIIYQKLRPFLSLENSGLEEKMEKFSKEIIEQDINSDGFVGIEDILKYNPIVDKKKLYLEYQNKIFKIIDDILNKRNSDFIVPIFKDENSSIKINENLIFIKKIEIIDDSALTILLTGIDANKFAYNHLTEELSFLTKVDFENPLDENKDNIFEFILEATDSYFNQTIKAFTLQVLDINEIIPQVPTLKDTNLSIAENNESTAFIGNIIIGNEGTSSIDTFSLSGSDSVYFSVDKEGKVFAKESFDYELKMLYTFRAEANNSVGKSNQALINIQIKDIPDIKPIVETTSLEVFENESIGTFIGKVIITNSGDSNISSISLSGYQNNTFQVNSSGEITVVNYLDYESSTVYYLQYFATNEAGDSNTEDLTINIKNIFENSGSDYPASENGIQSALDNGDYSFVLNELLNNRNNYSGLDDDTVNMNIAGAYVGSSGYTVYDITGAMTNGDSSSFNNFVDNITQNNDAVSTISQLSQADNYYSNIVEGLDCTNTANLTKIQQDSCYNLGLVRLTSLSNSVKLLFGGDSQTVKKWANGVDVNSSDDLNGNGVLDESEASACAIVYANNPNDSCQDGTFYAYKGGVSFNYRGKEHKLSLIEVDVGNSTNGYQSFYQFISSNANNNTPILTSGTCTKTFTKTSQ